jgi:hypothetical protein
MKSARWDIALGLLVWTGVGILIGELNFKIYLDCD